MLDVFCVGHASFDISMGVPHHPNSDEKMLADGLTLSGGGPAANAAVQVARLGGSSGLCTYLGNDTFGDLHISELASEHVDSTCIVRGEHPSPVSQILAKPDGYRSVVNYKGDSAWLPADAVDIHTLDRLSPHVVLFDGHEPLLSATICDWAKAHDIPTLLDAGSVHRGTHELASKIDYLLASESFARQFCAEDTLENCLASLAQHAPNVVITCGAKGLIWSRAGHAGKLPAYAVESVDSTGAGDAFHGAFALAVAHGMTWDESLSFASAAGALTCTQLGARAALPDKNQLKALMDRSDMDQSGMVQPN